MKNKKLVVEILSLARSIREGKTAIGDFLRADVRLPVPAEDEDAASRYSDFGTTNAFNELGSALKQGFRDGEHTFEMLLHQLQLMRVGVVIGYLDSNFFARIGNR